MRAARGNERLLRDAVGYRARLVRERVPLRYRRIVVRAEGDGRVERVVHAAADADWRAVPGSEEEVHADTLCVGYGFFPSVELLRLAGCDFATTRISAAPSSFATRGCARAVDGISAAGDGTGVTGSYAAIDEGRLAALGAALDLGALSAGEAARRAAPLRRRPRPEGSVPQRRCARFTPSGPGIYELATPTRRSSADARS